MLGMLTARLCGHLGCPKWAWINNGETIKCLGWIALGCTLGCTSVKCRLQNGSHFVQAIAWTNLLPFCRRRSFSIIKICCFISNLTTDLFLRLQGHYFLVSSDNGWTSNRQRVIIWTNGDMVYSRTCASSGLNWWNKPKCNVHVYKDTARVRIFVDF